MSAESTSGAALEADPNLKVIFLAFNHLVTTRHEAAQARLKFLEEQLEKERQLSIRNFQAEMHTLVEVWEKYLSTRPEQQEITNHDSVSRADNPDLEGMLNALNPTGEATNGELQDQSTTAGRSAKKQRLAHDKLRTKARESFSTTPTEKFAFGAQDGGEEDSPTPEEKLYAGFFEANKHAQAAMEQCMMEHGEANKHAQAAMEQCMKEHTDARKLLVTRHTKERMWEVTKHCEQQRWETTIHSEAMHRELVAIEETREQRVKEIMSRYELVMKYGSVSGVPRVPGSNKEQATMPESSLSPVQKPVPERMTAGQREIVMSTMETQAETKDNNRIELLDAQNSDRAASLAIANESPFVPSSSTPPQQRTPFQSAASMLPTSSEQVYELAPAPRESLVRARNVQIEANNSIRIGSVNAQNSRNAATVATMHRLPQTSRGNDLTPWQHEALLIARDVQIEAYNRVMQAADSIVDAQNIRSAAIVALIHSLQGNDLTIAQREGFSHIRDAHMLASNSITELLSSIVGAHKNRSAMIVAIIRGSPPHPCHANEVTQEGLSHNQDARTLVSNILSEVANSTLDAQNTTNAAIIALVQGSPFVAPPRTRLNSESPLQRR